MKMAPTSMAPTSPKIGSALASAIDSLPAGAMSEAIQGKTARLMRNQPAVAQSQSQRDRPAPVSDGALRVIQSLSAKLFRLKQEIAEATSVEEQAAVHAEERKVRCTAFAEHRQQASAELERLRGEHRESLQYEQRLVEQTESSQAKLSSIHLHQERRCVPRVDYTAVKTEYNRLITQHSKACEEGDNLRAQIAKEEKKLQDESSKVVAQRRMTERQDASDRAEVLARLESLQKKSARERSERVERYGEIGEKNRQAESELSCHASKIMDLEQRSEASRLQNVQLEKTLKITQEAEEKDLAELRDELRRRNQQIKVLSDLLLGPLSEVQPNSGRVLTEAGLVEPNQGVYSEARKHAKGGVSASAAAGCGRTTRGSCRTAAVLPGIGPHDGASVSSDSFAYSSQPCTPTIAGVVPTHVVTLHDGFEVHSPISADGTKFGLDAVHENGVHQSSGSALLIYNPQGDAVTDSTSQEMTVAASADDTIPEKRQTSTPGPVEQVTRPDIGLKQFTEGWGRVSGTTLSTDLSGPLLHLEDHSLSSIDSGGIGNSSEDIIR